MSGTRDAGLLGERAEIEIPDALGDLVDTHCHLTADAFADDRDEAIARARAAGVTRLVVVGDTFAASRRAVALAAEVPGVYAAVGIHPHEAESGDDASWSALAELAGHPKVVAIGEIGLDYHYDFAPRGRQRTVFAAQIDLARRLQLPIIVHNREADDDMRELLGARKASECGGVLHCFWSDAHMADWAIGQGFYLGVGGPLTFKNSAALRALIAGQPLDRLLVETDSPYLAPVPQRGKRNEPAWVVYVAAALAELFGMTPHELAAQTTRNAETLFRLA